MTQSHNLQFHLPSALALSQFIYGLYKQFWRLVCPKLYFVENTMPKVPRWSSISGRVLKFLRMLPTIPCTLEEEDYVIFFSNFFRATAVL